MSKFGWSYPAGCGGPPDEDEQISSLREEVYNALEKIGIDQECLDKIDIAVREYEAENDMPEPEISQEEELRKIGVL